MFKSNPNATLGRFKYGAFEMNQNIKGITADIHDTYNSLCKAYFLDENSVFYKPSFSPSTDSFSVILKGYLDANLCQVKIPKPNDSRNSIDNILSIYLILFLEVTKDRFFLDLLVKFVFLFRNYLNLSGWDHNKFLHEYGLLDKFEKRGEYCANNNCEQVPELINDFVSTFIELDPSFAGELKDLTDITQNFCYWLYINSFTNFKLFKNPEK